MDPLSRKIYSVAQIKVDEIRQIYNGQGFVILDFGI